ncbi:MAG: hypothetical protein V4505_13625 [Pseudomonadota bacterium]
MTMADETTIPTLELLRLAFRHGTRFLRADGVGGYQPFKAGERQAFRDGMGTPGFLSAFALVTDDYGASRWEATPADGPHVKFNSLSVAELRAQLAKALPGRPAQK